MKRTLKFGGLSADLPDLDNPGMTQAHNCVWADGVYKPLFPLSTSGDALDARCQGAFAGRDEDGNVIIYAGDATKLYQRASSSWTGKSNGTYTTQAVQLWKFRQYDSLVIATNFADAPQKITIGDGGDFADLNANAPQARHIGIIGQFVFLGDTSDTTNGHVPHRVQWSAIGDPDDWPIIGSTDAANKQSDEEFLNSNYGKVQAISDGERFGLVFQETGITRFTYVGGASIFEVDTFERSRGLIGPNAYAQVGDEVIFLAANGFYKTNGTSVVSIGTGRVDDFVLDDINADHPQRISTATDYANKLIYFSYPTNASSDGTPDALAIYNYVEDKWTTGEETVELIFSSKSLGFTLEDLDTVSASLDDLPASLDSPIWTGGAPQVGGFDSSHKLGSLSGTAKTAVMDTQEAALGGVVMISGVRPLVEGSSASTVSLLTRALQSDSQTVGTAVTTHARTGMANFRTSARYVAARLTIAGGFTRAFGADIEFEQAGEV